MMTLRFRLAATLALGVPLALSVPAHSQTNDQPQKPAATQPAPTGPGYGRMGYGRGMMGGRGMRGSNCYGGMRGFGMMGGGMGMMRYPDGTLAFLKAELKIKDSQSKQWGSFAHALHISAETMQKMRAQHWATRQPRTLKVWLQYREEGAAMRLEIVRHMSKALIQLYDSLDASQKKMADGLFMPCSGRGMGRGMGWWNQPAANTGNPN